MKNRLFCMLLEMGADSPESGEHSSTVSYDDGVERLSQGGSPLPPGTWGPVTKGILDLREFLL